VIAAVQKPPLLREFISTRDRPGSLLPPVLQDGKRRSETSLCTWLSGIVEAARSFLSGARLACGSPSLQGGTYARLPNHVLVRTAVPCSRGVFLQPPCVSLRTSAPGRLLLPLFVSFGS